MRPWLTLSCFALSAFGSVFVAVGCGSKDETPAPVVEDDGEWPRHGLTREQAAQALAKVGDTTITVGELAEALADQSPYLRARYNSPERRREFLDNLIRFELLAQEAERRGLQDLPEVQRTRNQLMIQQMLKTRVEDAIQLSDVTDEEIQAHYEAHRDEFNKPEQVRASHILMRDEAAARRVLREILAAPEDMLRFRQLAERHDEDPETSQGSRRGDLRFFSRDGTREDEASVPSTVAEAAFNIRDIGAVHPELVRSDAGFHIVKLTGRRAALSRSLDESRRAIQNRLWREKRERAIEELVERLRSEADIQTNEAALSAVRIDLPSAGVPEIPTSADELEVPEIAAPTDDSASGDSAGGTAPSAEGPR